MVDANKSSTEEHAEAAKTPTGAKRTVTAGTPSGAKRTVNAGASSGAKRATGAKKASSKRAVTPVDESKGLSTQDLILIAVLLAAGAVLKMTVASFFAAFGMKPNFIIAMYCLAIILTRPSISQAGIIGVLAGLICQLPMLNATPGLNVVSEALGALVCGLLVKVSMNVGGKVDINPFVNTFISTCVSGGAFALMAIYINVISNANSDVTVGAAIASYAAIVLGTATFNAVLNQILAPLMRKVLKR